MVDFSKKRETDQRQAAVDLAYQAGRSNGAIAGALLGFCIGVMAVGFAIGLLCGGGG